MTSRKKILLFLLLFAFIAVLISGVIFLNKVKYFEPVSISIKGIDAYSAKGTEVFGTTPLNRKINFQKSDSSLSWKSSWGFLKQLNIVIPDSLIKDSLLILVNIGDFHYTYDKSSFLEAWKSSGKENPNVYTAGPEVKGNNSFFSKLISLFHLQIFRNFLLFISIIILLFVIIKYHQKIFISIKKIRKTKIKFVLYFVILFAFLELILRAIGFKPHNGYSVFKEVAKQKISPYIYRTDTVLGNVLYPGNYITTTGTEKAFFYKAVIGADSTRITRNIIDDSLYSGKDVLAFLGCSVTYGFGIDDSLTFPWLIQQKFPNYNVKNYGVPGYGTLQMLLKLRKLIHSNNKPKVVVLMYFSGHDLRNTMCRKWRQVCYDAFSLTDSIPEDSKQADVLFPYARNGNNDSIEFKKAYLIKGNKPDKKFYHPVPLSNISSISNLIETFYNYLDEKIINNKKVSRNIFKLFKLLCDKYNIKLVVVGFYNDNDTKEMLKYCSSNNMLTLDASLDLKDNRYNLMPVDKHPNARANRYFADKIEVFLKGQ